MIIHFCLKLASFGLRSLWYCAALKRKVLSFITFLLAWILKIASKVKALRRSVGVQLPFGFHDKPSVKP
jgi:hypothetical protein